jgi:hypothetical protein
MSEFTPNTTPTPNSKPWWKSIAGKVSLGIGGGVLAVALAITLNSCPNTPTVNVGVEIPVGQGGTEMTIDNPPAPEAGPVLDPQPVEPEPMSPVVGE